MFRDPSLRHQLTTPGREGRREKEKKGREAALLSRTTSRTRGGEQ